MNKRFREIVSVDPRLAKPLRAWRKANPSASPDGLRVVYNEWRDAGPEPYGEAFGIFDENRHTAVTNVSEGIVRDWVYTLNGERAWVIVLEF